MYAERAPRGDGHVSNESESSETDKNGHPKAHSEGDQARLCLDSFSARARARVSR